MEEKVVEILLKTWGHREPTDPYHCIDLCLVNLETEKVRSYGGDKLYGGRPSSAMVPLGDDIYIVGGDALDSIKKTLRDVPDNFVHSTVSRINVYDFDGGWKNVTPFTTPVMGYESQMFPSVTLNNMLYVFGDTFGQVYDPKSPTQWTSLPAVPLPSVLQGNINLRRIRFPSDNVSHVGSPVLADSGKNRIILHLPRTESIYAYYPNNSYWERLVEDFDSWSDITVLFDNMLLFYYRVNDDPLPIQAYDLETNKWLNPVSAPESDPDIIFKHCDIFDAIIPMEQPRGTFYLAASQTYSFDTDGTNDRPNIFFCQIHC